MAEELKDPFLTSPDSEKSGRCWHNFALTGALFTAAGFAIALAVTWIKELPCSPQSNSGSVNFPEKWLRFYHLADIHYDPYYDSSLAASPSFCRPAPQNQSSYPAPYGRVGCDTPLALLNSAVKAMEVVDEEHTADFIVVTGDFSAHRLEGSHVLDAIQTVTKELREIFPDTYVFPCLGNNDVPEDYYIPTPPTNWYKSLLNLWRDFMVCPSCVWRSGVQPISEVELEETFLVGGYYQASLSSKLTLLVLNTVYYSTSVKQQYRTPLFEETAEMQLTWLLKQLENSEREGRKVIIAGHIPPGINPYTLTSFWVSNYTEQYVDIISRQYPHVIAGQLFAHMHKDDFKVFFADQESPSLQESSPMLFTSAISPVYNNNPNFRLVFLDDETQKFTDYRQWYLDLAVADEYMATHWLEEYTFSQSFPSSLGQVIDSQRICSLSDGILSNTTWLNYLWHRQAEYLPDQSTFSRFQLHCVIRNWNESGLEACKQKLPFIPG
eukprot:m.59030 g.59030  ORF g.59030 m.59030 type:complete len:495 (+) comp34857_c0_seq2:111-1595(+)